VNTASLPDTSTSETRPPRGLAEFMLADGGDLHEDNRKANSLKYGPGDDQERRHASKATARDRRAYHDLVGARPDKV
jgi:hypothetical protein